MRKILKKYVGEIMIVIGLGFVTYNVFNFFYTGGGTGLQRQSTFFYYHDVITLLLITFGVMLFVSGVLVIRNKK